MEANTKQQQLLFDKGITNVPSDNLCSDNTLAESVGMVYEDGEHRVIQEPSEFITSAVSSQSANVQITGIPTLLYIHKFNDQTRYIANATLTDSQHQEPYNGIVWGTVASKVFTLQGGLSKDNQLITYENGMKITSVGKTLVVTKSDGMDYFLWKNGVYGYLGPIPEPKFNFWFSIDSTKDYDSVEATGDAHGVFTESIVGYNHMDKEIEDNAQETFNDLVVGLYAKNQKSIAEEGGFCEPFFIRYALEMYDGSYYYISNPILLFPLIKRNSYGKFKTLEIPGTVFAIKGLTIHTRYSKLFCSQSQDYTDFSDIIKDIVLFASDGVSIYSTGVDQHIEHITSSSHTLTDGICGTANAITKTYPSNDDILDPDYPSDTYNIYDIFKKRDENYIIDDIKSRSVFYYLCSLGTQSFTSVCTASKIQEHALTNLTVQEAIEYDDYYSRCKLIPDSVYSYNSRLNLSSVKRGFFDGYQFFMPWDSVASHIYEIYVTIATDNGDVVVKKTTETTKQMIGFYFYYPDSRATNVVINIVGGSGNPIVDAKLTEHPGLNGAYYFAGLPATTEPTLETSAHGSTTVSGNPLEVLPNYIIQSEVNNPWVFQAKGYFKVGTGKIIGMSSITQALSEGQFGSYPLLVFSESGVWALSVASTGYYSSIHPMSREVCNNAASITQTDGAVFFTSEKGLMVVVGSQVKCVSEQLSGKQDAWANSMYGVTEPTFPNCAMGNVTSFFRNCHIAYDYRDSLLWIFSNSYAANYCYIYSIKSGVFSKYKLPAPSLNCVNNYPDYLIQVYSTGKVYSLLERPDINYDTKTETVGSVEVSNPIRYPATMLTRPMKLENALALKSIMHLENIKLFSAYEVITDTTTNPYTKVSQKATVKLRIFASNNLESWVEIGSLRGVPWKYYRFRYDFVNLIATDRFAGTVVVTQERRTDKIR